MYYDNHTYEAESWRADYLQNWSRLTLGLRRHLARIAPQEAFQQILSDSSDEVLDAFLENPRITQAEILILIDRCRSRQILEKISRTSKWYANHTIKRRLLSNPLIPYGVATRILDYLPFVELQRVMVNVNLPRDIRNKARNSLRKAFMRLSEPETRMVFLNTEGRVLRELAVLTAKDKRILRELVRRPNLSRTLVGNLARSVLTPSEVLRIIGQKPAWSKDAAIRKSLLANPKTPQKVKEFLTGKG